jgi:hypothetical protein
MNNPDPSLTIVALRRQLDQRKLIDANIHNLAKSIFKPGVKVQYRIGARDFFGSVIEVNGAIGTTHVVVENIGNPKARKHKVLGLTDIVGLVQET